MVKNAARAGTKGMAAKARHPESRAKESRPESPKGRAGPKAGRRPSRNTTAVAAAFVCLAIAGAAAVFLLAPRGGISTSPAPGISSFPGFAGHAPACGGDTLYIYSADQDPLTTQFLPGVRIYACGSGDNVTAIYYATLNATLVRTSAGITFEGAPIQPAQEPFSYSSVAVAGKTLLYVASQDLYRYYMCGSCRKGEDMLLMTSSVPLGAADLETAVVGGRPDPDPAFSGLCDGQDVLGCVLAFPGDRAFFSKSWDLRTNDSVHSAYFNASLAYLAGSLGMESVALFYNASLVSSLDRQAIVYVSSDDTLCLGISINGTQGSGTDYQCVRRLGEATGAGDAERGDYLTVRSRGYIDLDSDALAAAMARAAAA
jgi:hypothetical protein